MLTYEALQTEVDAGNLETLKEMYAKWPFFQSTVELIETVMAKVDVDIVKLYQKELVTPVLSLSRSLSLSPSLALALALLSLTHTLSRSRSHREAVPAGARHPGTPLRYYSVYLRY